MHSLFLFLFLWFLSPVKHSNSSTPVQTQNSTDTDASPSSVPSSLSFTLQHFNCLYEEKNGLAIFCSGVDLAELAPNIPNDTIHLEVTESPLRLFTKPLLSHLHKLRYLKLNHNAHRFITTNAFLGLHSLKVLDLSFNDITVLLRTFIHTPNLEVLNLTANHVRRITTIAAALSYLPNFRNLSLDHNVDITRILRDDLIPLGNTSLTKLELFNTTIQWVDKEAFRPLRHLKLLDLSVNYLDAAGLRNVTPDLGETSIEVLLLRYINIRKGLPYEALSFLGNTSILRLDLGFNYFPNIPKFPRIPTLTRLWLPSCSIQRIDNEAFNDLPNLELLELSDNEIYALDAETFSLPKVKYLFLLNQIPPDHPRLLTTIEDYTFSNMSSLLLLDLKKVPTYGSITRYTFYGLQSLQKLSLSSARIQNIADYAFETLVSLEFLELNNNQLAHLTNYTFFGLSELNFITLAQNAIKFAPGVYPFNNSPALSFIALNSNEIVEIPPHMFSRLSRLSVLLLSENKVVAWNSTILFRESSVTVFLLSHNKISHVTAPMIDDFLRVNDTLDVTDNPFNCSACGMKDFQEFINQTNLYLSFPNSLNATGLYTCSSPKNLQGKPILEVDIPVQHCLSHETNMAVFVTTLILSLIIPVVLVSVFCYAFRWYIRYWLFHLEATVKERRKSKGDTKHYLYDAFVSYNSSDTPWVVETLIPALEEKEPRFRLCIHERDFEVGRLITDNILDTIEVSRKVILLLSESFLKSEWCLFELHMAQHKLFDETRDVLVLVKLKNIDKKLYTKNLKYLEKTRTCLSWTDNPMGQKLFWDKMKKALGKTSNDDKGVEGIKLQNVLKV